MSTPTTQFAFYTTTSGSTLPASSIGAGSVTPDKADLTQTWNFTGALQINGVAVSTSGSGGSTYSADESSLHLSGTTFSVSSSGVTTTHLSDSAVTTAKIANAAIIPAKVSIGAVTWDFSPGILRASAPTGSTDVANKSYVLTQISASIGGGGTTYSADESTLHLSGTTFSVHDGGVSTTQIADRSVTTAKIAFEAVTENELVGNICDSTGALQGGDGVKLSWRPDESTLEINGSNLAQIVDGGVTNAKIADATILPAKVSIGSTTWDFSTGVLRATSAVGSSDVVIKSQLDSAIAGVTSSEGPTPMKGSVRLAFPMDDDTLGFFTYDSGAKTLTAGENFNINSGMIAGFTDLAIGQRILFAVKQSAAAFAASGSWSGIYDITSMGADDPGGSAPVFTRASNFDSRADIVSGSFVFAEATNSPDNPQPAFYYLATTGSLTFDSTPLLFLPLTKAPQTNAAKGAVRAVLNADDDTVAAFAYDGSQQTLTFTQGNTSINEFGIGDFHDFSVDDRVLFAVQPNAACFAASGSWGGIYTISNVGQDDPGGSAPVLTRAEDFNSTDDIAPNSFVFSGAGPGTEDFGFWYLSTSGSITLDSTPLLFMSTSFGSGGGGGGGGTYDGDGQTIQMTLSNSIGYFSLKDKAVTPNILSGSVFGLGIAQGEFIPISVAVDNTTIQVTGSTDGQHGGQLTIAPGGINSSQLAFYAVTPDRLNSSVAGNGLNYNGGFGLSVSVDNIGLAISGSQGGGSGSFVVLNVDGSGPLFVSSSGLNIRPASASQSGYMSSASFQIVSNSAPPATFAGNANEVSTTNTQTATFYIGAVPVNTIWTIKFNSFSVDTGNPVNHVNNIGALSVYRSGSNNVVQVGGIEVEHTFATGSFSSVTMSLGLAGGQPGNVSFNVQGINTYNMKHWAKFQVTEFTYA